MKKRNALLGLAFLTSVAGCQAVQLAELDVPVGLKQSPGVQKLQLGGLGSSSGQYGLGAWSGQYNVSGSGFSVLGDLFSKNKSASGFTLSGPGFDTPLYGQCSFSQSDVTISIVSFSASEGAYRCDFKDQAGVKVGGLVLGEPKGGFISFDVKTAFEGRVWLNGTVLAIRSKHKASNAAISTDRPLGYVFTQLDYPVAAIDINTKRAYIPGLEQLEPMKTSLAGIVAVSLFNGTPPSNL